MTASERMEDNKYAITDPLRQAVIDLLVKACHPQATFEQVNNVIAALSQAEKIEADKES